MTAAATRKVSYAQNAEDIRVWRAFADPQTGACIETKLTYVDVGANEPRHLSITASLYDMGWRGLLIEADPELAQALRIMRPRDQVIEMAAAGGAGELTFYRVPGTGLGTLDAGEAEAARARGFEVLATPVATAALDEMLTEREVGVIHFMSIDVEGAESVVLQGLSLTTHRPWVLCVEAVLPGTSTPSHQDWEPRITKSNYKFVAFDGVNRWYVADEQKELAAAIATPFNALDAGVFGWVLADTADLQRDKRQAHNRRAWQRELILGDTRNAVATTEYEKQIHELRTALNTATSSRSWRASRKVAGAGKAVLGRAQVMRQHLPGPIERAIIRKRHLRHVQTNLGHLVDPAFLGKAQVEASTWINPEQLPALPTAGLDLGPLTAQQVPEIRDWLGAGRFDTDELLARRTDNHDDELGRLLAALRLRLRLAGTPPTPHPATGNAVLFDARSLQTAAFGARGIGRFARSALLGLRETLGDEKVVLLVDRGLAKLPVELAGACEQLTRVTEANVNRISVLVEPSPMTAPAEPLVAVLHSSAHKIAIVFDFIPMHYPSVYLKHAAERAEYASSLDALRCYDEFLCISGVVKAELATRLGRSGVDATVAWPKDLGIEAKVRAGAPTGPIVVMTGDEQRKNTYGALAAIGVATAGDEAPREVIVIGMAGQQTRVHHWSIHAAMRPGEAVTVGRLSEADLHETLRAASVVVVPSFDEGLSLPVIEAVGAGAHVVASDIPAHRELIGGGVYLANPKNIKAFAKAIRRHLGNRRSFARQQAKLMQHQHGELEQVLLASTLKHLGKMNIAPASAPGYLQGKDLSVGIASPWPPQKSGIADFSAATSTELAKLCNLTIYTTADAEPSLSNDGDIKHRPLADIFNKGSNHDVFVTLLGNSHFHLPMLELMQTVDAVALLHDTRMVELYLALRGPGGVEQLMLRGQGGARLHPPLEDQINDMRLLQNAGMWEIANRARMVISHSPSAAPVIAQQTGITPKLLLFANYRFPSTPEITEEMRADARRRLQFADTAGGKPVVHIASFGFIDVRTKMVDVIIESAAWLTQWGHQVALHFVGSASADVTAELTKRAKDAGIFEFEVTGFIADEVFRDYVLAVDIGLQLRVSPLLGVSGPLSDMAAYGTPAMASSGLAIDVDTPAFIDRLPDEMSPLMVAEALEYRLANPIDPVVKEQQRLDYLDRKSPRRYAEALLALLQEAR